MEGGRERTDRDDFIQAGELNCQYNQPRGSPPTLFLSLSLYIYIYINDRNFPSHMYPLYREGLGAYTADEEKRMDEDG